MRAAAPGVYCYPYDCQAQYRLYSPFLEAGQLQEYER